jgi:hypothetical protein
MMYPQSVALIEDAPTTLLSDLKSLWEDEQMQRINTMQAQLAQLESREAVVRAKLAASISEGDYSKFRHCEERLAELDACWCLISEGDLHFTFND